MSNLNQNLHQDLVMETTHGRKPKCKTEFKAVLNKVLVSGLVLATILGSTTPAFAATSLSIQDTMDGYKSGNITQEYGINVESAIQNIQNTIKAINDMKANGSVSEAKIKELATQLYSLETAVKSSSEGVTSSVENVVLQAEKAISGLSNATEAEIAVSVVKATLGIADSVSVENAKSVVTETPTSFSDVPTSHWGYNNIMAMTAKGLFAGTGQVVNGVGKFSPTAPMKRAEFVTVVMRALYQDELNAMPSNPNWWQNAYDLALDKGILKDNELDKGAMEKAMSRQEMALVLVRATEQLGQSPTQLVDTSRIADYNTVGTYYRDSVVKAYSMGMLAGTDAKGTYAPVKTMNRAEGATVLNRLIDSSSRIKVDFSIPSEAPVSGVQTIKEGEISNRLPAKEGDIFIKADGTKITLKKDANGVLGGGQGVAPDLGMMYGDSAVKKDVIWHYRGDVTLYDSLGNKIQNQTYYVNKTTGEGYWGTTWRYLQEKVPAPTSKGSYEGEVSKDSYNLYRWSSVVDLWVFNK